MQGRIEKRNAIKKNMAERRLSKSSISQKGPMKVESGTCNVCSAPCSSCMHLKLGSMGSKQEEFSDETCRGTAVTSEASNLVSVNSSHDSFFANAESKANTRCSDIHASEDAEKTFPSKNISVKGADVHDDNISSVSWATESRVEVDNFKNLGTANLSHGVTGLGIDEVGKGLCSPKLELLEVPYTKEVNPVGSSKIHPKSEVENSKDSGDQADEAAFKSSGQDEHDDKSSEMIQLHDMQEPSLQAMSGDESDESEMVEQDVKVCDICGDAGREEMLAICSRCSDGAEHTYCMREMLLKVPEGEWMCEECKFADEIENKKQGLDAEGKRENKVNSCKETYGKTKKRHAETIDMGSAVKRQAIESFAGSPKSFSPTRKAAVSRESSFKSFDKGKIRPTRQTSFGNHSNNDNLESARSPIAGPRLQSSKSVLSKSNSFNAFTSKPKVKLVDDVPPQKAKGSKDYVDTKGASTKMIGKSMSFKPGHFSRQIGSDSKVKSLSSKFSHVQDQKGLKQVNERSEYDRKKLPQLDRSLMSSTTATSTVSTPKADQKRTPRGDSISLSNVNNNRKSQVLPSDIKSSALAKSASNLARNRVEIAVNSGGASSTNTICRTDQKSNQATPKDEPTSSSSWTDRTSGNATRVSHDSGTISSREDVVKGNKLKAAIEAAMRKKPGFGKGKGLDQSDGLPVTSNDLNCERASDGQLSALRPKSLISFEGGLEKQVFVSSSDSYEQTTSNNWKQPTVISTDTILPHVVMDLDCSVPSVAKQTARDWTGHSFASISSLLKSSPVPEPEYIWQGGFEVNRGENFPELCDSIQAHLSASASNKVLKAVKNLSERLDLCEVSRSSIWPLQFLESGAKEDHIALYFFAMDLESYKRNYKGLVDSMIKNDLALKGNIDGVDLLIFPSNQLPENCQRWNTLFFLWGVFRERKSSCSSSSRTSCGLVMKPEPMKPEQKHGFSDVPLQTQCFHRRTEKESKNSGNTPLFANGDGNNIVSSADQTSLVTIADTERQNCSLDSKFLSRAVTGSVQFCREVTSSSPPVEEDSVPEGKLEVEPKPPYLYDPNATICEDDNSSRKVLTDGNKVGVVCVSELKTTNRKLYETDLIDLEKDSEEDGRYTDRENTVERDLIISERKRPHIDLTESSANRNNETPQIEVNSLFSSDESLHKKAKTTMATTYTAVYGCGSSRDGVSSEVLHNLGPSCSTAAQSRYDKSREDKIIPKELGNTERYFFPVDSRRPKSFSLGEKNSMLWNEHKDMVPNLELALGAETKPQTNKGMLPFFVGNVENNSNDKMMPDKAAVEDDEDDDVSASLSLSLSFPFSDQVQNVETVSKRDQVVDERRNNVNPSLLFFGSFQEK